MAQIQNLIKYDTGSNDDVGGQELDVAQAEDQDPEIDEDVHNDFFNNYQINPQVIQ